MTEEQLIERMLEANFGKIYRTFSGGQREVVRKNMRAALAVARPIIEKEIIEKLITHIYREMDDYTSDEVVAEIRKFANK